MSNKYSLGGYRIALQAKSKKTILVEGKSDKDLLNKFRTHWRKEQYFDIDSADILDDPQLSGLGAKSKIDFLLSSIPHGSPIEGNLRALVDREWETLIDSVGGPLPWTPPQNSATRYLTLGHSIENYQFVLECVTAYCAHFGSGFLTDEVREVIASSFSELLFFSAAYSSAVRQRSAITRCGDALRLADISWDGSKFSISGGFPAVLASRGIQNAGTFVADVEVGYSSIWNNSPLREKAYLYAHGHLGESIIWIGVAVAARSVGIDPAVCEEFAFGRRDERQRFCQSWLTTAEADHISPLPELFA